MSDAERERNGIRRLPTTLKGALDELKRDKVLTGSMRELLRRSYLAIHRSEDAAFSAQDEEFEMRNHFYKF